MRFVVRLLRLAVLAAFSVGGEISVKVIHRPQAVGLANDELAIFGGRDVYAKSSDCCNDFSAKGSRTCGSRGHNFYPVRVHIFVYSFKERC
jgi:hypothetical protein